MTGTPERYDAAVVGGGLAGLATASSLARLGLSVAHLAPPAPADRRTSALMMPSVAFLRDRGLIGGPQHLGHALSQIRIIDATGRLIRAPETLFSASEAGLEAFGWNFANAALAESFRAAGAGDGRLEVIEEAAQRLEGDGDGRAVVTESGRRFSAALIVGADGRKSMVRQAAGLSAREHVFDQSALVCDLDLERPLDGCSVEFHYPKGPFTLVPAGGRRANLVWIDDADVLAAARTAPREDLARRLVEKSQGLFGTIETASGAVVFPLSSLSADRAGRDGVVLVGEAAHAFPPIGAQGLNLGLRDIAALVEIVRKADRSVTGWGVAASERYADERQADVRRTGLMVDALFRSLVMDMLPAQLLRAGGLWALKAMPGLRRRAFALGMGASDGESASR